MEYVELHVIQEELASYYRKTGRYQTLPAAAGKVLGKTADFYNSQNSPFPLQDRVPDDETFYALFDHASFSVGDFKQTPNNESWRDLQTRNLPFSKYIRIHKHLYFNASNSEPHTHSHFEITVVMKGGGQISVAGHTHPLAAGDVCIIAPGIPHSMDSSGPESFLLNMVISPDAFESILIQISQDGDLVSRYLQHMLFSKEADRFLLIHTSNDSVYHEYLRAAACEAHNQQCYSYSIAMSWITLFLDTSFREFRHELHRYPKEHLMISEEHILLVQYIQNNYTHVTLASLAELFNYNKAYLSRLIVRIMGRPLSMIVNELRLQKAADYLVETNLDMQRIAEQCGFDNQNYFGKAFKKQYGVTPSAYRKQHR